MVGLTFKKGGERQYFFSGMCSANFVTLLLSSASDYSILPEEMAESLSSRPVSINLTLWMNKPICSWSNSNNFKTLLASSEYTYKTSVVAFKCPWLKKISITLFHQNVYIYIIIIHKPFKIWETCYFILISPPANGFYFLN